VRFHLLGMATSPTVKAWCQCAFVPLIWNMARMIRRAGHQVVFYGAEGSDVPCDEFVPVVAKDTLAVYNADRDRGAYYYQDDYRQDSGPWIEFRVRCETALRQRVKPGEFVLCGGMQDFAGRVGGLDIEYIVGYPGTFSKRRVFPSHAWRHTVQGMQGKQNSPEWDDAVIPHYLDMADWPMREPDRVGEHVLFLGRLGDHKGLGLAAKVAQECGVKLLVSGLLAPGQKIEDVLPRGRHVVWAGPSDHAKLSEARCLFAASRYTEPFGMVVIEAGAVGCPVVTTDWGAFPEIVQHGTTGYRCNDFEEFVAAVDNAPTIYDDACRQRVVENYSLDAVWPQYDAYFRRVTKSLTKDGWYWLPMQEHTSGKQ
jgi:glycosyltransferase involved in cell wall biosynthesis